MSEQIPILIKRLPDSHLALFAVRLADWMCADPEEDASSFTNSRARAMLRADNALDDPTLGDFRRLVDGAPGARLALHDLLRQTGLDKNEEVHALVTSSAALTPPDEAPHVPWLALALAAFAWRGEYPLAQLDPASPPKSYTPAGQVVRRAAAWMRRQVQRTATDRDKLGRQLTYEAEREEGETAVSDRPIAPLPPHFRSPVPVRYPEVSRETLHVEADDEDEAPQPPRRGDPIAITDEDLPDDEEDEESPGPVTRMPPLRITEEQVRQSNEPTQSSSSAPPPRRSSEESNSLTRNVRGLFGRSKEPLTTTKLRVVVQEYPDGPPLYGLQVQVSCRGIKSEVAGTTNREGHFRCELPVRVQSGLTYDVDVTWPRDMGGETEQKSITLNADRTEFMLPFYRRHRPEAD